MPHWFPWFAIQTQQDTTQNVSHILCDRELMRRLGTIGGESISELYGKLFTGLWNMGSRRMKVSGGNIYDKLTPLWLRIPANFVNRVNMDLSTP